MIGSQTSKLNSLSLIIKRHGQQYQIILSKNAVVYLGHLPHGFFENQLKEYFSQYGDVLSVKVARSKQTARSKGYAFIQFKFAEVAEIVADAMNGYMLMGKVMVSNVLP